MTSQRALLVVLATALLLCLRPAIAKPGQDTNHRTLYILPTHLVDAGDIDEDGTRDVPVVIPTLVESPVPMAWSPSPVAERSRNARPAVNKRQVRYHQCYFNPISCFG